MIDLLFGLHAGDVNFGGIDDHHVIAGIEEGRVLGVLFARQDARHTSGKAPEGLTIGIDHIPLAREFALSREIGRHNLLLQQE